MNEPLTAVELYVLVLVANGTLPPEAWDYFRRLLTPPAPLPDPAPGVEFAPRELPEPVAARVLNSIVRIAADNPRREAEAVTRPPDQRAARVAALEARVARVVGQIRGLDCRLDADTEPRD